MGDFFALHFSIFVFLSCRFFMARLEIGKQGACLIIYMKLLHLLGAAHVLCPLRCGARVMSVFGVLNREKSKFKSVRTAID